VSDDFAEKVAAAKAEEITPRRAEMRRAGAALRRIIDKFVATKAPEAELSRAADKLEEVAAALQPWPQGRVFEGFAESANAGDPHAFFDHSPIMGKANPLAPPLNIVSAEGTVVVATVVFGAAYEGPPGCVHGGYVAATFDELLGMTQSMTGKHGMTGRLTISYRKPTPLHRELRFEGEIVREQGRKILTEGRCLYDGEVTAEAEGLFVTVDFSKIAELYLNREAMAEEA
jgi:acyl-coenzyme A thioesterase PaaI-like protein